MLEEGTLAQLGTVVVDELHLIGDPGRGYLLELLLTKIRFMTSRKPPVTVNNNESSNLDMDSSASNITKINIQVKYTQK